MKPFSDSFIVYKVNYENHYFVNSENTLIITVVTNIS